MPQLTSLKGDRSFQRLRKGRGAGSRYLSIRWRPTRKGEAAVGIVVSRKVGKAVTRNRVRRRLKEALRELLNDAQLPEEAHHRGKPSFDLVVITRPEAAGASYSQLREALKKALQRGKLL